MSLGPTVLVYSLMALLPPQSLSELTPPEGRLSVLPHDARHAGKHAFAHSVGAHSLQTSRLGLARGIATILPYRTLVHDRATADSRE